MWRWFAPDEARLRLKAAQVPFVDRLVRAVAATPRPPHRVPRPSSPSRRKDSRSHGELHLPHRPARCDELEADADLLDGGLRGRLYRRPRGRVRRGRSLNEEQFRFHIAQIRELGGFLLGRKLYETMLVWETDPSLRENEPGAEFADAWSAIPKVVFSRTLDSVQGNARLAEASVAEEAAAALVATDNDVAIGGAGLAAAAIELGLVDELRMFRNPVIVGGGTPLLPASPRAFRWSWSRPGRSARA